MFGLWSEYICDTTWVWQILKKIHPWYCAGSTAVNFTRLAITIVSQHLETIIDQVDMLGKLIQGKDNEGKPIGLPELTDKAISYLNADTGTTS